ncbi:hypothetical protein F5888DRAFT_1889379 [Russula emetica]|nr:hypothetical protein F5888DRAFT_1889379 [Russula emetica]
MTMSRALMLAMTGCKIPQEMSCARMNGECGDIVIKRTAFLHNTTGRMATNHISTMALMESQTQAPAIVDSQRRRGYTRCLVDSKNGQADTPESVIISVDAAWCLAEKPKRGERERGEKGKKDGNEGEKRGVSFAFCLARWLRGKGYCKDGKVSKCGQGKIGWWASRDIPVLGSLAWCQQRIDLCWAIGKVLDQRRTLAVAKLPRTQSI